MSMHNYILARITPYYGDHSIICAFVNYTKTYDLKCFVTLTTGLRKFHETVKDHFKDSLFHFFPAINLESVKKVQTVKHSNLGPVL